MRHSHAHLQAYVLHFNIVDWTKRRFCEAILATSGRARPPCSDQNMVMDVEMGAGMTHAGTLSVPTPPPLTHPPLLLACSLVFLRFLSLCVLCLASVLLLGAGTTKTSMSQAGRLLEAQFRCWGTPLDPSSSARDAGVGCKCFDVTVTLQEVHVDACSSALRRLAGMSTWTCTLQLVMWWTTRWIPTGRN